MILGNVIHEDIREKALEKKDAEIEIKKITISIAHDIIMILGIENSELGEWLTYQVHQAYLCFSY